MQIQDSIDCAIQILQYLHKHQEAVQAGPVIAKALGISHAILIRLTSPLEKKGLLTFARGRNGGYALGKPAHEISFYDVFTAVEGEPWIYPYLKDGRQCTNGERAGCKVHEFLQTVQGNMIAELSGKPIADLV